MQFTIFLSYHGIIEWKIRSMPQLASTFPLLSRRLLQRLLLRSLQQVVLSPATAVLRSYNLCQSVSYDGVCITSSTIKLTKHHGGARALLEGSRVCGHCLVKHWHLRCSESRIYSACSDSIGISPDCSCLFEPVKYLGLGLSPVVGKYKSLELKSQHKPT